MYSSFMKVFLKVVHHMKKTSEVNQTFQKKTADNQNEQVMTGHDRHP